MSWPRRCLCCSREMPGDRPPWNLCFECEREAFLEYERKEQERAEKEREDKEYEKFKRFMKRYAEEIE